VTIVEGMMTAVGATWTIAEGATTTAVAAMMTDAMTAPKTDVRMKPIDGALDRLKSESDLKRTVLMARMWIRVMVPDNGQRARVQCERASLPVRKARVHDVSDRIPPCLTVR
jgi:hypothetical protein